MRTESAPASSEMMPPDETLEELLTFISRDETSMPARQLSSSFGAAGHAHTGWGFALGRRSDPLHTITRSSNSLIHSGEYSREAYKPTTVASFSASLGESGAVEATSIAGSTDDLQSAGTVTAVVDALRRRSLDQIADRIEELAAPDHDEPDQPEIDLGSLKRAVAVVLEHPQWGEPEITLRDDRYLHLAWALKGDGRVAISFIPQGRVRFSVLSAPTTVPGFLNVGGRHLQQPAIGILDWFFASSHDR